MNHLSADILIDYLHGELGPREDAGVHAHLAVCAECRAARDAEAGLTEFLRTRAAAEEREFPSLVAAAVWQRVRDARPSPFARLRTLLQPAIAVPVAAALLVGGWFASPLGHGSPNARSVDVLYYLEAHAAQSASSPFSEQSGVPPTETSMLEEGPASAPLVDQYTAYALPGEIDAAR